MKKIYSFTVCIIFTITAFCQDSIVSYYDAHWITTTIDKAEYTRKKIKNDKGWFVVDYYKSGQLNAKGIYLDDSLRKPQGDFTWYNEKGNLVRQSSFIDGKQDGPVMLYYDNGKKEVEGNCKMDKPDGDWTAYYESGKISATVHFTNGREMNLKIYNEDGSVNNNITVFARESSFPGGNAALAEFLSSHLKYPSKAVKNVIQGTVVVEFVVDKDGSLTDIQVVKSVDPLLDEEALRVIKKMPKWEPAVQGGRLVKSYKRQPVQFKLQ